MSYERSKVTRKVSKVFFWQKPVCRSSQLLLTQRRTNKNKRLYLYKYWQFSICKTAKIPIEYFTKFHALFFMAYQLSNSSVLCVSFAIFGQDSPRQNGGVVWTGLSGCRWHVQKNNKKLKQNRKPTSSIKFIVVHTPLQFVFVGRLVNE